MRIRTKILLSHLVKLMTVTLVCAAIVVALAYTNDDRRQLKTSYEQLRNINLVAAEANRYSEQIAELFILNGQEADIPDARDALLFRLERQRELITREHVLAGEPGATWGGLDRIDEMERLVQQIGEVKLQLISALALGDRRQAELIYSREIEHRLDRMLWQLIEQATARERQEVEQALASSENLSRQSIFMAISLIILVGILGIGNVLMLNRLILRPVADLAAGAEAVGKGDLNYVVGNKSGDEFSHLADRFNQMTRQLREQRDSLLQAKATLAEQVETRTRELRERTEQLETTNEKLRAVNASRASFFADISHELRTPLTILRGQAEVTLRDPAAGPEHLRSALEAVVRKAEQIGRLVDDLLFLARSETGSIMVRKNDVVLQEVIADILLDGRGLLGRKDVTILPHQPSEPLIVRGDGDRLRQAVLIALDNAIKLAPPGTTVQVGLAREAQHAVIRVRDEGLGFTEEELGSAFTRFYSGKPSRGRSGRGLGLGLSIAKWIVDQHDGTIRIDSRPDGGATVEIAMPLVEAAA